MYFKILLLCCVVGIEFVQAKSLAKRQIASYSDNPIIQTFRKYLRIDTSNPENIYQAVEFWRGQADILGASFRVLEPSGTPICVITVKGSDPTLPSIMLNSHMDVVPAVAEDWTYPPFDAHIDENGDIFGRGTQDTKDVSIQHIEALKTLKKNNVTLSRTLHMTLMPDEETGGFNGIKPFLNSTDFAELNVGFALDEGLAATDNTLLATYVDKRPWQMSFTFQGVAGHGSAIPNDTAVEQATRLMNQVNAKREEQKLVANSVERTDFGSYTAINVNILSAGTVVNIIPNRVNVRVDMRLATSADPTETQNMVNSWMAAAGSNTTLEFLRHDLVSAETAVDDSNPFWVAIREVTSELDIPLVPVVCPATSDMLVVRNKGIPAIGLAPKFHTTSRIHGIDEYLNAATFLNGIDFYVTLLTRLGNVA